MSCAGRLALRLAGPAARDVPLLEIRTMHVLRGGCWPLVLCVAWVVTVTASAPLAADEAKPADPKLPDKVTYEEHIAPIFREHCFTCHGQDDDQSGLALHTFGRTMQGGSGGEVVIAGDLEASRLWMLVSHQEDPKMPPEQDRLPDAQLALIKQWIATGALENAGSKAKVQERPKVDLSATAGSSKPSGPPPMPAELPLEPLVVSQRSGAATALAASPWAPLVAVGGQKQILLYHAESGELLGILPFAEGVPHVLKFSRSGAVLLAGGGQGGKSGRVVLYDVRSGQRLTEIGDELDAVLGADVNNDQTLVALGGPRRVVRVYSVADGSLQYELRKHTDWVYAVEFSPDGVLLATSDRAGGLLIWEAATGQDYQNLLGHTQAVTDVSWRLDSNVLASVSEDGTCRLWEMENGRQLRSFNVHAGGAAAVEFGRSGEIVTAGRDKQVKLWDQNGRQIRAFEAFAELALEVCFALDDTRVVAGDFSGEYRVWNKADGKQVASLSGNPPSLAERARQAAAQADSAKTLADKAAAEAAATTRALADKSAATKTATARLAEAQDALERLEAELPQLEKAAAEKAQTVEKAAAEARQARAAEEEAVRLAREAGQRAAKAAAAAQAAAQERDTAAKALETAKAARKSAAEQLPSAKVAAEKLAGEVAALEKQLAEKQAAAKAARAQADRLKAESEKLELLRARGDKTRTAQARSDR